MGAQFAKSPAAEVEEAAARVPRLRLKMVLAHRAKVMMANPDMSKMPCPCDLEVAFLWLMQDAAEVSEWEVPVRLKILWDELRALRQTITELNVQRSEARARSGGTAGNSR